MNNLLKTLLPYLFVLIIIGSSCAQTINEKDSKQQLEMISEIFYKEIIPHLKTFAERQYQRSEFKNDKEYEMAVQGRYLVFEQKAKILNKKIVTSILNKGLKDMDAILEIFEFSYRNEFVGLDFQYFKEVRVSANKMIEKTER